MDTVPPKKSVDISDVTALFQVSDQSTVITGLRNE
jgi:hypothetical protein